MCNSPDSALPDKKHDSEDKAVEQRIEQPTNRRVRQTAECNASHEDGLEYANDVWSRQTNDEEQQERTAATDSEVSRCESEKGNDGLFHGAVKRPNAKVSDRSQPPVTLNLSLSEPAGSGSLDRLVGRRV